MICNHVDPYKEAKVLDPTGLLLDYMKHCGVFKSKKTNEYDLCHFYQVGLSRDLPNFPSPHEPATPELFSKFLLKARVLGHPNLVVAFVWDSATAICLLQELHIKDSLRCLPMEPNLDAGRKVIKKLSFCLLCMYSGSNYISYMNHIMCVHYHANYRCGQCLNEVFTTGQQLKGHLKVSVGLPRKLRTALLPHLRRSVHPKIPHPTCGHLLSRIPRKASRCVCARVSIPRRSLPQLPRRQTPPQRPANPARKSPTNR